jgi:hypothetical protein
LDRIGDGLEMRVETVLCRLVVVGNNYEGGVGPGFLGMAGLVKRLGSIVRSRSGDYRHPPGSGLNGKLDNTLMFLLGQRRRFTRGADRNNAMRTFPDLPVNDRLESLVIGMPIDHGCYQGNDGAAEIHARLLLANNL